MQIRHLISVVSLKHTIFQVAKTKFFVNQILVCWDLIYMLCLKMPQSWLDWLQPLIRLRWDLVKKLRVPEHVGPNSHIKNFIKKVKTSSCWFFKGAKARCILLFFCFHTFHTFGFVFAHWMIMLTVASKLRLYQPYFKF